METVRQKARKCYHKNSEKGLQIMKNEKTDIAKELSRICKEKGISRYSLSKRTGIPDSTLQNYENGTTPNFSTLEIICEALGTTIAGFFQGDCFSYFTEDQEELMSLFEKMGPDDRQRLLAFADGLASDL